MTGSPVALITYSTKPRGGVVHTVELAEALHAAGRDVHLVTLGDPDEGFYRPVRAPHTILRAPTPAPSLEERVADAVDALTAGLAPIAHRFRILHTQDCIAARAAARVRDRGARVLVLRTVHHVDDFITPALVDCQRLAILEPDHVLVVSEHWRRLLAADPGVEAEVVANGVDLARFSGPAAVDPAALRARLGVDGRFLFLTVGGIEPRKGSAELFEAMAALRTEVEPAPVLAVLGGHSFQDHTAYREAALARAAELGLEHGRDLVVLGTVPDAELVGWYRAADAFVLPSTREGWGLAVLEALAAARPVVASDIEVFRSYLSDGENALLSPVGDAPALAATMRRVLADPGLRDRLRAAGPAVAARYRWERSARGHAAIYDRLAPVTVTGRGAGHIAARRH
ncbi:MAG: MSMEG_0565 family glycosyltransferase [Chloroflexi bacterium]|nr:MAG: MSMEG_0565 family glycosyltransferase [Chloroflexota bacterium]